MKKIITILVLVLAGATSFAQYNRQVVSNNTGYDRGRDAYHANADFARQREFEIARINRDFNFKVQSIESRLFVGRRKKDILIREAQIQRDNEIQMVMSRYRNEAGRFDRHDMNYR